MQPLDLYASIEQYFEFDDEVTTLYNKIKNIVISKKPSTLIDIGCGQGEFCKLIETHGIDALGVDLSKKQIEIALSKDIKSQFIDIKDIKDKYDCATAIFDVVNYLPYEYVVTFLQNTYNLLNTNGYFIFDINSLYGFDVVAQGALIIDLDDRFISIDAIFEDSTLYTDITLFTKNDKCYTKDTGTIEQYYYKVGQLEDLLKSVGFSIEKVIDFKLHDCSEADDKYIFICKK